MIGRAGRPQFDDSGTAGKSLSHLILSFDFTAHSVDDNTVEGKLL